MRDSSKRDAKSKEQMRDSSARDAKRIRAKIKADAGFECTGCEKNKSKDKSRCGIRVNEMRKAKSKEQRAKSKELR
ncbi:hypothetical protein CWO13_16295 [Vibrio sp. ZF 223]|nr:hypothetical protein CWO13_16295 [Vibrio sp. ZF 223]